MGTVLAVIGYVLLSILAVVLLLPLLPVFVRFTYRDELSVQLSVLGIPVLRFSPSDEPSAATPKEDKPPTEKKIAAPLADLSRSLKEDGVGTALRHIRALARIAGGAGRRILAAVTVDELTLRLYVAAEDASATAQNVGRICAVLYPALTTVQAFLRIRHRAVTVTPDYLADTGRAEAAITVHAVPYRLLFAVLLALPAYFKWKKTLQRPKEEEQYHG